MFQFPASGLGSELSTGLKKHQLQHKAVELVFCRLSSHVSGKLEVNCQRTVHVCASSKRSTVCETTSKDAVLCRASAVPACFCSTDVLRARVVAPRPIMGIPIPVFRKDDEAAASPRGAQGSLEPCRFGRYSRRLERNPFRCARPHGPLGACLRAGWCCVDGHRGCWSRIALAGTSGALSATSLSVPTLEACLCVGWCSRDGTQTFLYSPRYSRRSLVKVLTLPMSLLAYWLVCWALLKFMCRCAGFQESWNLLE